MNYISVKETAAKWGISQTQVRKYCTQDRIPKAKCQDGIWLIPEKAKKPEKLGIEVRIKINRIMERIQRQFFLSLSTHFIVSFPPLLFIKELFIEVVLFLEEKVGFLELLDSETYDKPVPGMPTVVRVVPFEVFVILAPLVPQL